MARASRRHQHCKKASVLAGKQHARAKTKRQQWGEVVKKWQVNSKSLFNSRGRARSYEENSLILLAIKAHLERDIETNVLTVNWTSIESKVASELKVRREHVTELRKVFEQEQKVMVVNTQQRGKASPNYKLQLKVTEDVLGELSSWVDEQHAIGESVTNERLRNWLETSKHIQVSRRQAGRYLDCMGLRWRKARPKPKAVSEYRTEVLEDYLIGFDSYIKRIDAGKKIMFVFTDDASLLQIQPPRRGEVFF